jgi:hypothetical protein
MYIWHKAVSVSREVIKLSQIAIAKTEEEKELCN